MNAPQPPLDTRARHVLRTLIALHVREGGPIGSRALARVSGLDLSPATIRNIMADLKELGLVAAPHTSAGRIPTSQGYRLFVDSLLQVRPLGEVEIARLRAEIPTGAGTHALLGNVSELLSTMSHFAGVVTVPGCEQFTFRHIEFMPLEGQRVLVILVFADNEVQNRIIQSRRPYSAAELERSANYLNQRFAGCLVADIRRTLLAEIQAARTAMEQTLAAAADLAEQALDPGDEDMVIAGQTRLMEVQDLSDVDRLRGLFEAFARKREILQLLERTLRAQGVRVFIGEESGLASLQACTVVSAPYRGREGQVLGVLGVIGPTRMAYEQVIPMVQATAQALESALNPEPPAQS